MPLVESDFSQETESNAMGNLVKVHFSKCMMICEKEVLRERDQETCENGLTSSAITIHKVRQGSNRLWFPISSISNTLKCKKRKKTQWMLRWNYGLKILPSVVLLGGAHILKLKMKNFLFNMQSWMCWKQAQTHIEAKYVCRHDRIRRAGNLDIFTKDYLLKCGYKL